MYKKFLPAILMVLLLSNLYAQKSPVKIYTDGLKEMNYLKADDFYLTHHLYLDLFLRENLFPEATPDEIIPILKAIKKYVGIDQPLYIEVEKPGETNYLIKIVVVKTETAELLIAVTNWNLVQRKFENKDGDNHYVRWYFLNDDKMTYRKDISTENDYSKMGKIDLANAYLFDELVKNDTLIEPVLDEVLQKKSLELSDEVYARLVLLKYYMYKRNDDKIDEEVKFLKAELTPEQEQPDMKAWKSAFNVTLNQRELMERMK